jgi:protoporphyrin/coproporphyrin ferrochelatase
MTEQLGLLVMSYGTARDLDDVEAYYTHIRRGVPPPPELLEDLKERYRAIGGHSPLTEITEAQTSALERELNREGRIRFRAYTGYKHQRPYIEDAVSAMGGDEISRGVGLVLAPHYSRLSVGQYLERARAAAEPLGVHLTLVRNYHDHPLFVEFVASRVKEALEELPVGMVEAACVVFSAHSLPARIVAEGDPYPDQLSETAEAVTAILGLPAMRIAWQSAGRTQEEWLGPDLGDVLRDLAAEGFEAVVSCPVGFVADHLENLYDVDVEARKAAEEGGLVLVRTRSPNDDPAFIRVLGAVVQEHLAAEAAG